MTQTTKFITDQVLADGSEEYVIDLSRSSKNTFVFSIVGDTGAFGFTVEVKDSDGTYIEVADLMLDDAGTPVASFESAGNYTCYIDPKWAIGEVKIVGEVTGEGADITVNAWVNKNQIGSYN